MYDIFIDYLYFLFSFVYAEKFGPKMIVLVPWQLRQKMNYCCCETYFSPIWEQVNHFENAIILSQNFNKLQWNATLLMAFVCSKNETISVSKQTYVFHAIQVMQINRLKIILTTNEPTVFGYKFQLI